jgi:two-component sensor histidine kinase
MSAVEAEHRAQVRQDLLAREVQHRTENLFSVVQAIVARSFCNKRTVREAETAVRERLHSLAQTHAILLDRVGRARTWPKWFEQRWILTLIG